LGPAGGLAGSGIRSVELTLCRKLRAHSQFQGDSIGCSQSWATSFCGSDFPCQSTLLKKEFFETGRNFSFASFARDGFARNQAVRGLTGWFWLMMEAINPSRIR
jgi:hypothetical protein